MGSKNTRNNRPNNFCTSYTPKGTGHAKTLRTCVPTLSIYYALVNQHGSHKEVAKALKISTSLLSGWVRRLHKIKLNFGREVKLDDISNRS